MDTSRPSARTLFLKPGQWLRRRPDLLALLLLIPILLMGAGLRDLHHNDWDGFAPLIHPDEYHVGDRVATALRVPEHFSDYLASACPVGGDGALIAPQNPGMPLNEQYPSAESGCNSLNPRNLPWAREHQYGSLPTTLVRLAVEWRTAPDEIDRNRVVSMGRRFSTLAELLTIIVIFLLGRHLAGRRVGLLGALLYAWAPFPIQQAHFFTVDAQATAWGMLALLFCVLVAENRHPITVVGASVSLGLAAASKINMAALGGVLALALVQRVWVATAAKEADPWHPHAISRRAWRIAGLLVGLGITVGVATVATLRLAMPDAFANPAFFDLTPDPRFVAAIRAAQNTASGGLDWPPSHQWASRTPYVYDLRNMIQWGMGVPLGLAAWAGWAALGVGLLRGKLRRWFVPWIWVTGYFVWQGGQLYKPMRYHLPIYGALALFAAWGLLALLAWARRAERPLLFRRAPLGRIAQGLILATVAVTVLWGWGYSRIYTKLNPRVEAAAWARQNFPPGSSFATEAWDAGLSFMDGSIWPENDTTMPIPGEDSPDKLAQMIDILSRVDYVVMSSNRGYGSLQQLPLRFPMTLNYYRAMFDGSLGFEQVIAFNSHPSFLGIPLNDQGADESWSVYDHPQVTIFRKTGAWSPAAARDIMTKSVNFDEIYPNKPIIASGAPTAMQLSEERWAEQRDGGSWADNFAGLANRAPLLGWLLLIEALGLAAWGLLWRLRLPLPDRGLSLARMLGLLALGWLSWLPASAQLFSFSQGWIRLVAGGLIAGGLALAWLDRRQMLGWLRERRGAVVNSQLIYLAAFAGMLAIRYHNPDLWHPQMGGEKPMNLAYLTATLKSEVFPPYDPWFAGGYINYYYWGYVLIGAPMKALGLDPAIGFNLALPTLFAVAAQLAGGLGYNLLGRLERARRAIERRARAVAWAAAVAVMLMGNLVQPILYFNATRELGNPAVSIRANGSQNIWLGGGDPLADFEAGVKALRDAEQPKELPIPAEWPYWNATRVVPFTINEFPFFSFLYGDLHAHVIALPLTLFALGLTLAAWRTRRRRSLLALGLALGGVVGALKAVNVWDYPTYGVLAAASLAVAALKLEWRNQWRWRWLMLAGVLLALGAGLTLPWRTFDQWLATGDANKLELLAGDPRMTIREFLVIYGAWLWALVPYCLRLIHGGYPRRTWLIIRNTAAIWVVAGLFLGGTLRSKEAPIPGEGKLGELVYDLFKAPLHQQAASIVLVAPLLALAGLALAAALRGRTRRRDLLPAAWMTAGLALILLTEMIVMPAAGRMNVVFKFGYQAWVLLALAAATALPTLLSTKARPRRAGERQQPAWFKRDRAAPPTGQPSRPRAWSAAATRGLWEGVAGLLVLAALFYPATATPAKIADRAAQAAPKGFDGMAWMDLATWRENDAGEFPLAPDAAAIRWLRANVAGTPTILEASTSAYRWNSRIATWTGLPTLLGWAGHQKQQRQPARAEAIIDRRHTAITRIYGAASPPEAQQLLDAYSVDLIYSGPLEQALYAGQGGQQLFDQLAANGEWGIVYDEPPVRIYQRSAPSEPPAALPPSQPVGTPRPDPLGRIRLQTPISEPAPVDGVSDWPWLAAHPLAAAALWWLLLTALGLLAWPISALALRSHGAGAWALSRTVGWLLLGWLVWFPASLGVWRYTRVSVLLAIELLALISLAALRLGAGARIRATLRTRRRQLLITELMLLAVFAGLTLLRAANSDLWHPYWGGEKPFEIGFLSSALRSPSFPPQDPFWSGGSINYYYYGLYLVSVPMKLLGLGPEIGVQLAVATVGMLAAGGAWGAALLLGRRLRTAAVAVALLLVFGNLAGLQPIGQSTGVPGIVRALQACDANRELPRPACDMQDAAGAPTTLGAMVRDALQHGQLSGLSRRLGEGVPWFWGPSRVTDTTTLPEGGVRLTAINEFPAWSLLFADLHAHLIALPIALLVIALALELSRRRPWAATWPGLALAAWAVGALIATNAWDVPGAALLIVGGLGLRAWHGREPGRRWAPALGGLALGGLGVAAGAALYAPFLGGYQAPVGGVWPIRIGTSLLPWLAIHGLFGGLIIGGALAARSKRLAASTRRQTLIRLILALGLLALSAMLFLHQQSQGFGAVVAASLPIRLLLIALLALLAGKVLGWRRVTPGARGALALATLGAAVALGVELVFIRDHLAPLLWEQGPGDAERMNTIFKFGFQVWVLWALAAALLLPHLLRRLRRIHPLIQGAATALLFVAAAPGLIFPVAGTISRLGTRFPTPPAGLTLDGLAYMETASYGYRDQQVSMAGDLAAIRWLQANVAGNPVVLQSEEEFYRAFGVRIAANTGLPTIVGALHAGEMRPGEPVNQRVTDAQRIYSTADAGEAQWLLAKYGVDYVYVGQLERLRDPLGAQKFAAMPGLARVYDEQNVHIYAVTDELERYAIQWRPNVAPPPSPELDEVALAEANYLAAPDNAGFAFEYGRLLWRNGRAPEAVAVLSDATRRHPQDVAMRHALGDVLIDSGRYEEGIERYRQAYDLAPSPENKVKLGTGYQAWARLDESKLALAESSFREAAEQRPDLAEAHYHLGNVYAQLGQAANARQAYRQYLSVAPADAGWRPEVEKKLAELGG